jgi:hypothetical protein
MVLPMSAVEFADAITIGDAITFSLVALVTILILSTGWWRR